MRSEIMVFWKLPDGTRCSVLRHEVSKWRLVVTRHNAELLAEDYVSAKMLFDRAQDLRLAFGRAATESRALAPRAVARSA